MAVLAGVLVASTDRDGLTSCAPLPLDCSCGDTSKASSTSIASSASPWSENAGLSAYWLGPGANSGVGASAAGVGGNSSAGDDGTSKTVGSGPKTFGSASNTDAPAALFDGVADFRALDVADLTGEADGGRFLGVPWLAGPSSSNRESKDGAGDTRDVWIGGTVRDGAGTGGGGMVCGDGSFPLEAFFASPDDALASPERRLSFPRRRALAASGAEALSGSSSLLSLSTRRFCFPFPFLSSAALPPVSLLLTLLGGGSRPASMSAFLLALRARRFLRI